jgi:integrase
MDSSSFSVD